MSLGEFGGKRGRRARSDLCADSTNKTRSEPSFTGLAWTGVRPDRGAGSFGIQDSRLPSALLSGLTKVQSPPFIQLVSSD